MKISKNMWRSAAVVTGALMLAVGGPASATHSWNGYHWARSGAELTVPVADNVDATWDGYLNTAIADWNQSTVINSPKVPGSVSPKRCNAVAGTIQVCNAAYGRTGWLGIASIWLSNGHISQGTTKLNDTYFAMAQYNNPSERALVTCQEVGHNYGLGHQDEDFNTDNTTSCMDYTNWPQGNEHPDAHDYQQLLDIYNHVEAASSTVGGRGASGVDAGDTPGEWGRAVHFTADGRPDVFQRVEAPGQMVITHVYWANGEGPRGRAE
ncbi:MAG TPA: hypothetical protein VHM92_02865 [Allosphingosinicella sp.]|nr:hypothetical protein [Allosphingosinicella sp.]